MRDGVHIRLTLTRGVKITSGMDPEAEPGWPDPDRSGGIQGTGLRHRGLSFVTSTIRRFPPHMLNQNIHSCNLLQSIMAKIEANGHGADDALMLDEHGFMAETNATHVFIVKDSAVSTSTTRSCPEGITRSVVLELCEQEGIEYEVRDIPLEEVHGADEVFCTGTMGELASVTSIDGETIGDGHVGPMTRRLSERPSASAPRSKGVRVVD